MKYKTKSNPKEIKNQLVLAAGTYNGLYFPPETIKKAVFTVKRMPVYLDFIEDEEHLVGVASNFRLKNNKIYCDAKIKSEYLESFALAPKIITEEFDGGTIKRIEIASLSMIPKQKVVKKE